MSTPWKLYNEVSQNNNNKDFSVYRCPEPTAVKTGRPWFYGENVCPCDTNLSNQSGRGFAACNFGINESTGPQWNLPKASAPV